jgi:HAE1 family hydrophobic/amphiphilic exporter-1
MLQDRSGAGLEQLQTVAGAVIQTANQDPRVAGARTSFRATTPQIDIDIDREQLKRAGASLSAVNQTLQTFLGSAYVNDFTLFGKSFKVMAQADAEFRNDLDDIRQLQIRSEDGRIIPLGSVVQLKDRVGPQSITRFNMAPAVKILGGPPPGGSSGEAMQAMEQVSSKVVPASMNYAWSELSYQQKQAEGGGMGFVFLFAIVMAYLVLAAQYESWTLPISVCLSVPLALLGAVLAILIAKMDNNLYTQIGIILLIGLATKTAILLTEFAKVKRDEGLPLAEAAVEAVRLRFRAVMMTALSFLLGVIPLLIASGAGAESRKVLGATVFGGMLVATACSLVLVPVLFFVVQWLVERGGPSPSPAPTRDAADS